MGFLTLFRGGGKADVSRLPAGTFTMDSRGRIVSSTIPHSSGSAQLREIGQNVIAIFQNARHANLPLHQLVLTYGALKITAREMRGGAIVFMSPSASAAGGGPT